MRSTSLFHDSRHRNPSNPTVIVPRESFTSCGKSSPQSGGPYHQWAGTCAAVSPCPVPSLPEILDLQDLRAALADDDCVGVREDGGDGKASRALDVHEERAGSRDKGLELVLAGLTGCLLVDGRGGKSRGGKRTRRARG